MKFYVLASLIVFIMIISHNLRKSRRIQDEAEHSFWEKERLANETRRKPLDNLNYIKIPLEQLPMEQMKDDAQVADCIDTIQELSLQPIVNFTGLTNTDLKLEYGTANITTLTEYDQSYALLVVTLQRWAGLLYQAGCVGDARIILEFSVETRSDIYLQNGETDRIAHLRETAQTLNSLNRNIILRHLEEKLASAESD